MESFKNKSKMLRKLGRNKQYIFFKRRNVENKRFWESWLISFYTLKNFLYGSAWKGEVKVLVTQLCPTLCNPMNCSPSAPLSIGILQARILEWVDINFSKGSSGPRDWIQVSCIAGGSLLLLLLLLSRFSRVRLCATPLTAAHIASKSSTQPGTCIWNFLLYHNMLCYITTIFCTSCKITCVLLVLWALVSPVTMWSGNYLIHFYILTFGKILRM